MNGAKGMIKMKKIKAVRIVALLSLISGLFGCKGTTAPQHTTADISGVSISCGHMNRAYGYSFWVRMDGKTPVFDADCFTHEWEVPTVLESVEIDEDEFEELLKIIEDNQLIQYAENYKQPSKSPILVLDDTTYAFCMDFTDGKSFLTNDRQEELETYFYALAEKYAETHNIAEADFNDESEEEE